MAKAMVSKFLCILTSLEAPIVSLAKLQVVKKLDIVVRLELSFHKIIRRR